MGAGAPDVMLVFSYIGQMGKIGKGTDNFNSLARAELVEHGLQRTADGAVLLAVEAGRGLADEFDNGEHILTLLLAHRVAQYPAQQTDILPQRQVFFDVAYRCNIYGHDLISQARLEAGHKGSTKVL